LSGLVWSRLKSRKLRDFSVGQIVRCSPIGLL